MLCLSGITWMWSETTAGRRDDSWVRRRYAHAERHSAADGAERAAVLPEVIVNI